jgi:thioredoxin reductase (NADPH)
VSHDADVDALIVGAGPVGLYAAYYAGFRGQSVAVMDSLPEIGGQVSAMYPEKLLYDVAGFPAVRGRDLIAALAEQAGRFEPRYFLGEAADSLEYPDGGASGAPVVTTASGMRVRARFVVVTGGIGTFTPRRMPALARYEGSGLAYFVPRPEDYRDKDVVIAGGGDSAFDWALTLSPLARSVTLVHRREKFRAHEALVRAVTGSGVTVITSAEIVAASGEAEIEGVEVLRKTGGQTTRLKAQAVVAALGFTADISALEAWGLEVADRRVTVSTTMATSLPRVYAAGDITEYPGKVRLIAVGFGEAATAVNNAVAALDPAVPLFPGHSSDFPARSADLAAPAALAPEPLKPGVPLCPISSPRRASTSWTSRASRNARSTASTKGSASSTSIRTSALAAGPVSRPARRRRSSSTSSPPPTSRSSPRTTSGSSPRRCPAARGRWAARAAACRPARWARTRRWCGPGTSAEPGGQLARDQLEPSDQADLRVQAELRGRPASTADNGQRYNC